MFSEQWRAFSNFLYSETAVSIGVVLITVLTMVFLVLIVLAFFKRVTLLNRMGFSSVKETFDTCFIALIQIGVVMFFDTCLKNDPEMPRIVVVMALMYVVLAVCLVLYGFVKYITKLHDKIPEC